MSYKNIITWAKINQIRLRESLELQAIQPEKYMKYAEEFGHAGHMLPILINYMVIHHTLTYNNNFKKWLKQDYKIQLADNEIQMAWLTSWLVVG